MNAPDPGQFRTALLGMSGALWRVSRLEDVMDQATVLVWSALFGPPGVDDTIETSHGGLLDKVHAHVGSVPTFESYKRAREAIVGGHPGAAYLEDINGELYLSRYTALLSPAGALKGMTCTMVAFGDAEWATPHTACPFSREPCGRISVRR